MAAKDPNALSWFERLRGKRTKDIYLSPETIEGKQAKWGKTPKESPIPKVIEGVKGFKKMQENLGKAAAQKRNDASGNAYRKSQKDAIMKGLMEGN